MIDTLTDTPKHKAQDLLSTEKCNEFACVFSENYQTDHQHHIVNQ